MNIADHLITQHGNRMGHGLYAGEQNVIHVNANQQLLISPLNTFSHGQACYIRTYPFRPYTRECSLQRAFQLLQANDLIPFETDEQFVAWCIKGSPKPQMTNTHSIDWENDVIEPVSRVLIHSVVQQLVEKLKHPQTLKATMKAGVKMTQWLRYLK